jgi:hypothetical protein
MNARNTSFAMFALTSLAVSAFAQNWTSEATCVQPAYVRPVVCTQPTLVARPVVTSYYTPFYRPVVAGYTPACVASPTTCELPVARPVVPAVPAARKVWVHEKVYVQGQPLRNLFTAITP